MFEMFQSLKGVTSLIAVAVLVVVRRWHWYRYVRPYMAPIGLAIFLHFVTSSDYVPGSVFGAIAQNVDDLYMEFSHVFSLIPWSLAIDFEFVSNVTKDVIGVCGVLAIINNTFVVYNWAREMIPMGLIHFLKYVGDKGFQSVKHLSFVRAELDKEKRKFEADMETGVKTVARGVGNGVINYSLPMKGMDKQAVLKDMIEQSRIEDGKWEGGKLSGSIYHGDREHIEFINQAFNLYSVANILHLDIWPSGLKYESEIISMTAKLLDGGDEGVCGCTTSGGTESIILAIKAHRDYFRQQHGITEPEMIKCISGHPAVDKACDLLGIRLIKAPMRTDNYEVDVQAVTAAITSNTIMIYSSAPSYPQGVIDPISELGAIASFYNIGLHVDCCLGGFILPFAKKLGYDIRDFDFGVKGVTSISCDTHKFGYALKGTSVLLFRHKELRAAQYFCYPDWPGGFYTTATVAGSRSGGMIAQTWASLVSIGEEGYLEYTRGIMNTAKAIADGIESSIPELGVIGGTKAMIVCVVANPSYRVNGHALNIHSVASTMHKKGWILQSMHRPNCFHYCATVRNTGMEDAFLADLKESVAELKAEMEQGQVKLSGNAAVYGMAQSLPDGPVAEFLKTYNDNILGKL